jgi:hypothetical protein
MKERQQPRFGLSPSNARQQLHKFVERRYAMKSAERAGWFHWQWLQMLPCDHVRETNGRSQLVGRLKDLNSEGGAVAEVPSGTHGTRGRDTSDFYPRSYTLQWQQVAWHASRRKAPLAMTRAVGTS